MNDKQPTAYVTGQVYQWGDPEYVTTKRYVMVLGHVWWNVEKTYAYYIAFCDKDGSNMKDPQYEWCQGQLYPTEAVEKAA